MHGKQQHRAIPIKHAKTTQKTAKNTSNARNITANLWHCRIRDRSICNWLLGGFNRETYSHYINHTRIYRLIELVINISKTSPSLLLGFFHYTTLAMQNHNHRISCQFLKKQVQCSLHGQWLVDNQILGKIHQMQGSHLKVQILRAHGWDGGRGRRESLGLGKRWRIKENDPPHYENDDDINHKAYFCEKHWKFDRYKIHNTLF